MKNTTLRKAPPISAIFLCLTLYLHEVQASKFPFAKDTQKHLDYVTYVSALTSGALVCFTGWTHNWKTSRSFFAACCAMIASVLAIKQGSLNFSKVRCIQAENSIHEIKDDEIICALPLIDDPSLFWQKVQTILADCPYPYISLCNALRKLNVKLNKAKSMLQSVYIQQGTKDKSIITNACNEYISLINEYLRNIKKVRTLLREHDEFTKQMNMYNKMDDRA